MDAISDTLVRDAWRQVALLGARPPGRSDPVTNVSVPASSKPSLLMRVSCKCWTVIGARTQRQGIMLPEPSRAAHCIIGDVVRRGAVDRTLDCTTLYFLDATP